MVLSDYRQVIVQGKVRKALLEVPQIYEIFVANIVAFRFIVTSNKINNYIFIPVQILYFLIKRHSPSLLSSS